jgi:hypothetical protein
MMFSDTVTQYQMLLVPPSHVQHIFLQNLLKVIHFKSFTHHITFTVLTVFHYVFRLIWSSSGVKIIVEENAVSVIVSRDSSVGIATGYGLDDRGVGVQVPLGVRKIIMIYHRGLYNRPKWQQYLGT